MFKCSLKFPKPKRLNGLRRGTKPPLDIVATADPVIAIKYVDFRFVSCLSYFRRPCYIETLPNEIIDEVLNYLDLNSLFACSSVSKRFHIAAIPFLWSLICIHVSYDTRSGRGRTLKEYKVLNRMITLAERNETVATKLSHFSFVHQILLVGKETPAFFNENLATFFLRVIPKCEKLKTFTFEFDIVQAQHERYTEVTSGIISGLAELKNLEVLRIHQPSNIGFDVMGSVDFSEKFCNLRQLVFRGHDFATGKVILLATRCQNLEKLELNGTSINTAVDFDQLTAITSIKSLRVLLLKDMKFQNEFIQEGEKFLTNRCFGSHVNNSSQSIKTLILNNIRNCTDECLNLIFKLFPSSQRLGINWMPHLHCPSVEKAVEKINHFEMIRPKFSNFSHIVKSFTSSASKLQSLTLGQFRIDDILAAMTGHSTLTHLKLLSCSVKEEKFADFVLASPNLKTIQLETISSRTLRTIVSSSKLQKLTITENKYLDPLFKEAFKRVYGFVINELNTLNTDVEGSEVAISTPRFPLPEISIILRTTSDKIELDEVRKMKRCVFENPYLREKVKIRYY
ncbi:hypothetical protein BKA69DRAFT_1091854 [Paraphysoderma sedebokerense]|nr:hypothetical protein BKA69DRAFT_1091854 [Paraphysoderma sedebokerense]